MRFKVHSERVGCFEFRSCDKSLLVNSGHHTRFEIVVWFKLDGDDRCATIAHWDEDLDRVYFCNDIKTGECGELSKVLAVAFAYVDKLKKK